MPGDLQELIDKAKGDVLYEIFKNDYNSKFSDDGHLVNQHAQDAFEGKRDLLKKDDCTCPILLTPLPEPVRPVYEKGESKHVYERVAIEEWYRVNGTEPLTRIPIKKLRPDWGYMKPIIIKRLLKCFKEHCSGLSPDERERVENAMNSIALNKEFIKAVEENDLDIVRQCFDNGTYINAKSECVHTALNLAAHYGNIEIVTFLLDNNADVDPRSLHNAIFYSDYDFSYIIPDFDYIACVKLLLSKGVDIEFRDNKGRTSLHNASNYSHKKNSRIEIVKLLLDKNVDIEVKDNYGKTPLHLASEYGHVEIIRSLLDKGAEINTTSNYGKTALHFASWLGYTDCVRVLLDRDANIDAQDDDLRTPLNFAAGGNKTEVVQYLLDNKAKIDHQDHYGRTALHRAVENSHLQVVKILLQYNPDLSIKNKNGETALNLAKRRNNYFTEKWATTS